MLTSAIPQPVASLVDLLRKTVDQERLSYAVRLSVAAAVRGAILPRRTPGKKRDEQLDKAYADHKVGMRGLELYRKHIPGHDLLPHWGRRVEEDRLRKNLAKRAEREKKRQQKATNPP